MSPEAKAAYEDYKTFVDKAQGEKRTGIRTEDYSRMKDSMKYAEVQATVNNHAKAQMEKHGTTGKIAWNQKTGRFEVSRRRRCSTRRRSS